MTAHGRPRRLERPPATTQPHVGDPPDHNRIRMRRRALSIGYRSHQLMIGVLPARPAAAMRTSTTTSSATQRRTSPCHPGRDAPRTTGSEGHPSASRRQESPRLPPMRATAPSPRFAQRQVVANKRAGALQMPPHRHPHAATRQISTLHEEFVRTQVGYLFASQPATLAHVSRHSRQRNLYSVALTRPIAQNPQRMLARHPPILPRTPTPRRTPRRPPAMTSTAISRITTGYRRRRRTGLGPVSRPNSAGASGPATVTDQSPHDTLRKGSSGDGRSQRARGAASRLARCLVSARHASP
jgi:hypothetical protein